MTDASASNWTTTRLCGKVNDGTGAVQPITGVWRIEILGVGWYFAFRQLHDHNGSCRQDGVNARDMGLWMSMVLQYGYADLVKRGVNNTGAIQDGYPVRTFDSASQDCPPARGLVPTLPGGACGR
ncbi:MAG: hypothetical protein U1F19_02065 [Lysobacterales bacterium]